MKIENIIERMLDHEFFDQDYQNAIAQHLKPTVLIPELKPLLKTTVSFDADSKFELPTKLPLPPSVSKHPICAYLYSVDQHEYPIIQRWAVHNLHAACILKAIPNPTEKDHQTTIIRVFNRFRLANEAYAASQQGKQLNRYQQEYLWLWEQLPSHEITLADFVKSLRELENDSKLNRFQYLLLLDIRRFYDYVLALKPKKHYSAPPKHIDEPIYLDEHNAILHCPYDMPQKQHPALFYEELQDEQPNQQYSINTAQVSPLTSQSSFLQHRVSKLTQQHIIRQQHNFSCSKHYPDFNSLSLLVQHCHQLYLNHPEKNNIDTPSKYMLDTTISLSIYLLIIDSSLFIGTSIIYSFLGTS